MINVNGLYTALVTPFDENENLDERGLRDNIRFQIAQGVDGITPIGTTGESPTLSQEEKDLIVQIAVEEAKNVIPIMVGTGSYSTKQTIENTHRACHLGADIALIVTPYYNKPTQDGIYQHFKSVASAVDIPIIVYNIQGRTGQNIHTNTLQKLAEIPNIIGVKEASGNLMQMMEVLEMIRVQRKDFSVMSGDDALTFPLMSLGGQGVISVVSNLIPKKIKKLVQACQENKADLAREIHFQLMPLFRAAFIETNPIPIKTAMNFLNMPAGPCRLPLCRMSFENESAIKGLMKNFIYT